MRSCRWKCKVVLLQEDDEDGRKQDEQGKDKPRRDININEPTGNERT